ncbi:Two-component response regulator, AmiR/NasT family, consists of REC and RNA-binding antiterminator (ANTAR) domains [Aureimonas altamirensis DSM 21988]|uniref:Two-component response regulator, AmiR/NasT family, consists of REC and RNA-binding antiterminator (ANTAR) domains n=1 Tax=Aureimonas altamirensis DSM 21988 TaxID=1121026 RepID=A0ABY1IN22_9HYPH|nr:ANTAR domain-containing protein [Aureimonas altamirensis]SHJ53054.1 Two-component response regulator, AmiR/NasT family, consists of REC and RNA-binding antiterminator (ANTAR) domains [Aureimonas altamirensis DSM 21988]
MTRRPRINLGGACAVVLHRPHAAVEGLTRQLAAIGLNVEHAWPDLPPSATGADFLFFDVDHGFDEQFPWKPGEAPMPLVALIGSEAPGRIEWGLSQRADAQLVKPVGNAGVYAALLIARRAFDERRRLEREIDCLRERVSERQVIVRAVVALAAAGIGEEQAYAQLRALAMSWQVTMELAAHRVIELKDRTIKEASDERPYRA